MVQPVRIKDFTRRQVRERERLFNPEETGWYEARPRQWNYMAEIVTGFFLTIGTAVILIFGWVLWLAVTWP